MSWLGPRSVDGGVDRVPLPSGPGALWLCGKHVVGADPEAALERVGATAIVCLSERHEIEARYPAYVEWLRTHGGRRAVWFPIPDLHAPAMPELKPFVEDLVRRLDAGEALLLHCGAGIGRAGTVAACILMALGVGRDEALRTVAAHRPMAGPEAGAQRDAVDDFAAELAG